ncbi:MULTISPECIES: MBL fold metallo-hydrolase [unclassified Paenibacillus]|uniref:MBL fold metallo-hydrolase n=1 Tax=unclassified Paenibacillus TaxID=185978 RepID=UPI00362AA334
MQATVWGGAGEHGRSCYLIEHQGTRVLLDCGVKKEGEGEYPLIDPLLISKLDAVFLSHAHEDHSMAIPMLYQMGYQGKVWTTRATSRQLPAYFTAWKQYVASQQAKLPYEDEHIEAIDYAYIDEAASACEWLVITPALRVCWGRSGHLAGSIWLLLDIEGSVVFFSGDYTTESSLLAVDWPELPSLDQGLPDGADRDRKSVTDVQGGIQLSIIDAAYGTDAEAQAEKLDKLQHLIQAALAEGGMVLLPVPVYGRGQELLLWASEAFPDTRLIVEKEIAQAFEQLLQEPDWLQEEAVGRIAQFLKDPKVVVVETKEQREQAAAAASSSLVFTNDGMMQSAKSQWYYEHLSQQGRGSVILTGHLAKGSFAKQLLQAAQTKMQETDAGLGEGKRAVVPVHFLRFKVHQGVSDVRAMLDAINSEQTLLVHANKQITDAVCVQLEMSGYRNIYSLTAGDTLS